MELRIILFIFTLFLLSCNDSSTTQESDINQFKTSTPGFDGDTRVRLPDSSLFEGRVKDGLFNGKGKLTWRNGDVYIGEFKNGLKHGVGTLNYRNVAEYEGEFVDGLWEGDGKIIYPDGENYTGEFKNGNFHGVGRYESRDGTIYEGDFKDGAQEGKGKIIYPYGGEYTGEIKYWMMHGDGVYRIDDVTYSGQFRENVQEGKGEIIHKQGNHYKGEIKNWLAEGEGELIEENGNRYKGAFINNAFHGEGTLWHKNGDIYTGEFESGMRHGMGTLTRAKPKGRKKELTGYWQYGRYMGEKKPEKENRLNRGKKTKQTTIDAESVFYQQGDILNKVFNEIRPTNKNRPNMYFLGFAAYGSQDVFMKETRYAKKMFDQTLNTMGRSVTLINHKNTVATTPLASVTNLKMTLDHISKVMDNDNDILFLYLTSHGSKDHELDVSLRGLPLNDLSAVKLAEIIKQSGIKWKVIAISSCYSGGFIEKLKDEHTLIMTSAKSDHVSFGCSDEAEFTYFGRALIQKSIPTTDSFIDAFMQARELVANWEDKEDYDHSRPQYWSNDNIEAHLQVWRKSLKPKTAQYVE